MPLPGVSWMHAKIKLQDMRNASAGQAHHAAVADYFARLSAKLTSYQILAMAVGHVSNALRKIKCSQLVGVRHQLPRCFGCRLLCPTQSRSILHRRVA